MLLVKPKPNALLQTDVLERALAAVLDSSLEVVAVDRCELKYSRAAAARLPDIMPDRFLISLPALAELISARWFRDW